MRPVPWPFSMVQAAAVLLVRMTRKPSCGERSKRAPARQAVGSGMSACRCGRIRGRGGTGRRRRSASWPRSCENVSATAAASTTTEAATASGARMVRNRVGGSSRGSMSAHSRSRRASGIGRFSGRSADSFIGPPHGFRIHVAQQATQPAAGPGDPSPHTDFGDAEHLGGLGGGQLAEQAELDGLTLALGQLVTASSTTRSRRSASIWVATSSAWSRAVSLSGTRVSTRENRPARRYSWRARLRPRCTATAARWR